jgi:hypothetical protein
MFLIYAYYFHVFCIFCVQRTGYVTHEHTSHQGLYCKQSRDSLERSVRRLAVRPSRLTSLPATHLPTVCKLHGSFMTISSTPYLFVKASEGFRHDLLCSRHYKSLFPEAV